MHPSCSVFLFSFFSPVFFFFLYTSLIWFLLPRFLFTMSCCEHADRACVSNKHIARGKNAKNCGTRQGCWRKNIQHLKCLSDGGLPALTLPISFSPFFYYFFPHLNESLSIRFPFCRLPTFAFPYSRRHAEETNQKQKKKKTFQNKTNKVRIPKLSLEGAARWKRAS